MASMSFNIGPSHVTSKKEQRATISSYQTLVITPYLIFCFYNSNMLVDLSFLNFFFLTSPLVVSLCFVEMK